MIKLINGLISAKFIVSAASAILLICTFQGVFAQNQSANIKKADSLYMAKDWAGAKTLYTQNLKDTSTNGNAWNRLGFSLYNTGDMDAAMRAYKKSITAARNPLLKASVYSRMARINGLKNNKDEAITNIDSAINSGYNVFTELDSLRDFNALRNEPRFKELRAKAYGLAYPCMGNAQARQFDFWVGEWNVYITGTKTFAGQSSIQIVSGGCAILENWTSGGSFYTGKSLNFVDPASGKWRQNWIGAGDNQDFVNGQYTDKAMRFTFEKQGPQGKKLMGRFVFYNEGPNQVRQFNETSADEGKTWVTAYDLTYIRKT